MNYFKRNQIDYLEDVLYAGNHLDNNEMELLYKFIETILKLKKILEKSDSYIRIPSVKEIITNIVYIKALDVNLTFALNTICKDIFKNYNMGDISRVMTDYRDYLAMLKNIGDTKTDRFPKNIIVEHDKLVDRYNLIQAENERKADINKLLEAQRKVISFKNAVSEYKNLVYENENYKITVPEVPSDLIDEGKNLNHCVGSYIDSVVRKSSQILFCRKQNSSNNAYMTIEIRNNAIVQAKKYHDSYPDKDDELFLKEFCKEKNLKISNY